MERLKFKRTENYSFDKAPKWFLNSGNNTEEGIWYHRPNKGTDLIITHPAPDANFSCIVYQPKLNYYLHIATPENHFYPNILR